MFSDRDSNNWHIINSTLQRLVRSDVIILVTVHVSHFESKISSNKTALVAYYTIQRHVHLLYSELVYLILITEYSKFCSNYVIYFS